MGILARRIAVGQECPTYSNFPSTSRCLTHHATDYQRNRPGDCDQQSVALLQRTSGAQSGVILCDAADVAWIRGAQWSWQDHNAQGDLHAVEAKLG